MIALGGTTITKAYLGSTELKNVAIGDELLLSGEEQHGNAKRAIVQMITALKLFIERPVLLFNYKMIKNAIILTSE
jgi:hypothetical protein